MDRNSREWQCDYLFLEQQFRLWYACYPPEVSLEAFIYTKQSYQVKYGLKALREVMQELTIILLSEQLERAKDGYLRRRSEPRTLDEGRSRRVRTREKAGVNCQNGIHARKARYASHYRGNKRCA
jgi:hypothetical protein